MTHPLYQLTVDNIDQLTIDQAACQYQPMVDTQQIRDAFAVRLNKALNDVDGVRAERGRNVDFHGLLTAMGARASAQATHKWLRAESMPEKDNMRVIARLANVRVEWLEYGDGPMREAGLDGEVSEKDPADTLKLPSGLDALLNAATPRSRKVVERIIELEKQGRLSAHDIELIGNMVDRFSSKE